MDSNSDLVIADPTKSLRDTLARCIGRNRDLPVDDIVNRIRRHPEEVRSDPQVLIRAVSWNLRTDIIRALVEACPDALSAQDEDGLSPLSWLGDMIRRSTDQFLLDQVARLYPPGSHRKLNPLLSQDVDGETPLHRCCDTRNTYPDVVKRILEVCPQCSTVKDARGKTPQQLATENFNLVDDIFNESPQLLPEVAAAFESAKTRAKRPLEGLIRDEDWDGVLARLESHPTEAAEVRPWELNATILHCAAQWDSIPFHVLSKIVDAFPEARLVPSENKDVPVSFAMVECLPDQHIKLLIDPRGQCLKVRGEFDRFPIHNALHNLPERRDLVEHLLSLYPAGSLDVAGTDGTPLDMASTLYLRSKKKRDYYWELLLYVLRVSHEASRAQRKLPPNDPFLPIHAAIEMYRKNDLMLDRQIDDLTWCHTGKEGITGEGLECQKEELYASIYLDRRDIYDDIIREYPCGDQLGELDVCYRLGRFEVLEDIIKAFPDQINVRDQEGKSPLELAKQLLKRKSFGDVFDGIMNENQSSEAAAAPEEKIFSLLGKAESEN